MTKFLVATITIVLLFNNVYGSTSTNYGNIKDPLLGHMEPLFKYVDPVGTIDEYNEMITPKLFWKYVKNWEPVMLRNAAKTMKAYHLWSPRYMSEKWGNVRVRGEMKVEDRKAKIPWGVPLHEYISKRKNMDFYAVSALTHDMAREVDVPSCMLCGDRARHPEYPEAKNRRWLTLIDELGLWLSHDVTSSILHYDQYNIMNCLLSGEKVWKMINTRDPENLKYMRGSWATGVHNKRFRDPPPQSDYSKVNVRKVDLKKYPGYSKIRYSQIVQKAGDCLYIPYAYLHQVHKNATGWSSAVSYMFPRGAQYTDEGCKDAVVETMPVTAYDYIWYFSGKGIVPIGYGSPENVRQELVDEMTQSQRKRLKFNEFFKWAQGRWGDGRDPGPLRRKRVKELWNDVVDKKHKGYITMKDVETLKLGDLQVLLGEFDYDELAPGFKYDAKPLSLIVEQQFELDTIIDHHYKFHRHYDDGGGGKAKAK